MHMISFWVGCSNGLLSIAYDSTEAEEGDIEHHVWAFRPKITLDSLIQAIKTNDMHASCPILYSFLKQVLLQCIIFVYIYCCILQESRLRATQYLPDIIHLQQYFHDKYASQIYNKMIGEKTVGVFLKESGGWYCAVLICINLLLLFEFEYKS